MRDSKHGNNEPNDPIEASNYDKRPGTVELNEDGLDHTGVIRGLVRALLQQGQRHG